MKRLSLTVVALSFALAAPSLGCRNPHLGPDTGQAYRGALAAQRDSDADAPAPMDAGDARGVLRKHRGKDQGSRGRAAGTTTSSSSSSSTTSLTSGSGSGSFGPSGRQIRLDAK